MVVALHATVFHGHSPLAIGSAGVDIFFVISGFIIARMLPNKNASKFVIDRVTRIYPIYWLLSLPAAYLAASLSLQQTMTSVTLWPAFGDLRFPYLVAGWTLCFEMLFYGAATIFLLNRRAGFALLALYPVAVVGAFILGWPVLRFVGNPIVAEFIFGLLIARSNSSSHRLGGAALIAGAALLFITAMTLSMPPYIFDVSQPPRSIFWGIPAAMIVWGALQFEDVLKGPVVRAVSYGGDASYSIYLTHGLTIWTLRAVFPWPIAVLLAINLGVLCYRFVELPLLKVSRLPFRQRPQSHADDRQQSHRTRWQPAPSSHAHP